MDDSKTRYSLTLIWTVVLILASSLSVSAMDAVEYDWRSLTSFNTVNRFVAIDDALLAATSGGVLLIEDPQEPARQYTNADGLGVSSISDAIVDESGQIWLVGPGRLIKFEGSASQSYPFQDQDGEALELNAVADDGDWLWIGAETGLVLFSKTIDGGQIQDSYGRFGDLSDFPTVNDILLSGDSIWLATDAGIAVAERTDRRLLKQRSTWTSIGAGLLGTGLVNSLALYHDSLYAATSASLLSIGFGVDTTASTVALASGAPFLDLYVENDTLFYYHRWAAGIVDNGVAYGLPADGLDGDPSTGINWQGRRWVGTDGDGLYCWQDNAFQRYAYSGLPADNITGLAVHENGSLTVGFRERHFGRLSDSAWTVYDFPMHRITTLVIDGPGDTALGGTEGDGLWFISDSGGVNYDENNSTLRGNSDNPPAGLTYVYITGLAIDEEYVYAACYRAVNGYPVAIGKRGSLDDPVTAWDSLGVSDGITNDKVRGLDVYGPELAVGSEVSGVFVCRLGDDPFDRDSTVCVRYTQANSFLVSDIVNVVRYSPDGELWVGTNEGLSRYDWGIERFVDVNLPAGIGRNITALKFDTRGNLWVGTSGGLAFYDAAAGSFRIYTADNSNLVSNRIQAIAYDSTTGNVFIGTDAGISWASSRIGSPEYDVKGVLAFPNPFVISSSQDFLSFDYARPGSISIFTVAGELVRQLDVGERWYGRNDDGAEVASGAYIFVIRDDKGAIGRGKILLVRR
jgi:ligand-binding sensor domain-containing protein